MKKAPSTIIEEAIEEKPKHYTEEQLQAWKEKYGNVYQLTAEDGKTCLVFDPLTSLTIMSLAFASMKKSMALFVKTILANCWLCGDPEILTVETYANSLEKDVDDIAVIPDVKVSRVGNKFVLDCEGVKLETRMAFREDVVLAEQKNPTREPFQTNIHLLKRIALDEEQLKQVEANTRVYIGFLSSLDRVKDKIAVSVKKL